MFFIRFLYIGVFVAASIISTSTADIVNCNIDNMDKVNESLKACEPPINSIIIQDNRLNLWNNLIDQTSNTQSVDIKTANLTSIEHIPICKWQNLKMVDLSNNSIETISDRIFLGCNKLVELILGRNKVSNMSDNAFMGLSFLTQLDLSINQISYLTENIFRPLVKLEILRMDTNRIEVIDADLFKYNHILRMLYLFNNSINVIQPKTFWNLKKLTTLDIGNNSNLTTIDLSNMTSLFSVILKNTGINLLHIPVDVNQIDASNSQITKVHSIPNSRLISLYLGNNYLSTLNDLQPVNNLINLYLEQNPIDFKNNSRLVEEILQLNKKMPQLRQLQISSDSMSNDQYINISSELEKDDISISILEVLSNYTIYQIVFHPFDNSPKSINVLPSTQSNSNSNEAQSINKTTNNGDVNRINQLEFEAKREDNIDEKLASLHSKIIMLTTFTMAIIIAIFIWIFWRNYENVIQHFQRNRNDHRNLSAQNLSIDLEESSTL